MGGGTAIPSDFGEGELVHAPQLLHADLEGVLVGVVPDDVVVHVHQNAVGDTGSSLLGYDLAALAREPSREVAAGMNSVHATPPDLSED